VSFSVSVVDNAGDTIDNLCPQNCNHIYYLGLSSGKVFTGETFGKHK